MQPDRLSYPDLRSASADLVHDARAPLLKLRSVATLLEELMPALLSVYAVSLQYEQTSVSAIAPEYRRLLSQVADSVRDEVDRVATLIDEFWSVIAAEAPDTHRPRPFAAGRQALADEPRGWRVLLVDDDATNLEVASDILEALGCHVDTAVDGGEALLRCARDRYDLILLDCRMPGRDGYDTARQIRLRDTSGPTRTPIVGLTASPASEDRARGLDAGMDEVATKPVTFALLEGLLERFARVPGGSAQ
jgi:CheY-like chemotaxis protein